jgi:hypothetical protein
MIMADMMTNIAECLVPLNMIDFNSQFDVDVKMIFLASKSMRHIVCIVLFGIALLN